MTAITMPVVSRIEQPDVVILHTGYEDRLMVHGIKNHSCSWRGLCEIGKYAPLTAGDRVIAPEEIDEILYEKMGLRRDYHEVSWKHYSVDAMTRDTVADAQWGELFCRVSHDGVVSEWQSPGFDEETEHIADPRAWRDSLVKTRANIIREVREACVMAGEVDRMSSGLCCLCGDEFPFEAATWMRDAAYCARFSPTSMHDITKIRTKQRSILIASFDAESS